MLGVPGQSSNPRRIEEAEMGAMGERFLILEETADALDVIDPELAVHFRTVNGLPKLPGGSDARHRESAVASTHHEIHMDVGDATIRSDCSCGMWSDTVGWDEIDTMVTRVRAHVGSTRMPSGDAMVTSESSPAPAGVDKQVG
jgi:hypothetical protein